MLPGKSLEVRTITYNVSSMVHRSGEVVEVLHKIQIGMFCARDEVEERMCHW